MHVKQIWWTCYGTTCTEPAAQDHLQRIHGTTCTEFTGLPAQNSRNHLHRISCTGPPAQKSWDRLHRIHRTTCTEFTEPPAQNSCAHTHRIHGIICTSFHSIHVLDKRVECRLETRSKTKSTDDHEAHRRARKLRDVWKHDPRQMHRWNAKITRIPLEPKWGRRYKTERLWIVFYFVSR